MKIRRKTKAQRKLLRKMKMVPFLWHIICEYKSGDLLAMHWLTGEFRYINK